jgi:hypothetical protein
MGYKIRAHCHVSNYAKYQPNNAQLVHKTRRPNPRPPIKVIKLSYQYYVIEVLKEEGRLLKWPAHLHLEGHALDKEPAELTRLVLRGNR